MSFHEFGEEVLSEAAYGQISKSLQKLEDTFGEEAMDVFKDKTSIDIKYWEFDTPYIEILIGLLGRLETCESNLIEAIDIIVERIIGEKVVSVNDLDELYSLLHIGYSLFPGLEEMPYQSFNELLEFIRYGSIGADDVYNITSKLLEDITSTYGRIIRDSIETASEIAEKQIDLDRKWHECHSGNDCY